MVAAARTPPGKARPTIALTAPARHTMKAGARPTRTPMAVKRRANMAKARRIRMPTAVKLRVNTEKGRLTRTLMAAPLQLNTGRVRRIRMFTAAPLLPRMVKARTTPAPMVTALRIIRQPLIMAIIRLPRSTTTDQHAPTATGGRLPPLSQPPLLLVRLSLQQMQTLPMLMLRPRQPTLTTLDTTPAQPRVNLPRPQQPWLRHQATIPWGRWLELSRPVALHPPSKARPTTCVAIPGSARPTAQTAFTIAWCLVPAASSLFDRWNTPV